MAGPDGDVQGLLTTLTGQTGESAADVYAKWQALTLGDDDDLETLVRRALVVNGHSANLRESLLGTLQAGGATGEDVEQTLHQTGLVGWS